MWARFFRIVRLVAVALVSATLLAAASVLLHVRFANRGEAYLDRPELRIGDIGDRILVFAPHPDDETLACGGLLRAAHRRGYGVRVVFITNGDAYRFAAAARYKTIEITPEMCLRFAEIRKKEAKSALRVLGLKADLATFLGYPDRGIAQMWQNNWSVDELYRSKSTRRDSVPYRDSPSFGKPYCGRNLLEDIADIIKREKPTDVFLPHHRDNHPDHYAVSCFVFSALEQMEREHPAGWTRPRVWEYVVHRGDWPYRGVRSASDVLGPPFSLSHDGEQWFSFDLGSDAELKRTAIEQYSSQILLEPRFMRSFARRNEIYSATRQRYLTEEDGEIKVDGLPDDWQGIAPLSTFWVNDTLISDLGRAGDLRAVYLRRCADRIYVRFDVAGRLSFKLNYALLMQVVRDEDKVVERAIRLKRRTGASPDGTIWAGRGHCMEVETPVSDLRRGDAVFIRVRTSFARLKIDDTGWKFLEVR